MELQRLLMTSNLSDWKNTMHVVNKDYIKQVWGVIYNKVTDEGLAVQREVLNLEILEDYDRFDFSRIYHGYTENCIEMMNNVLWKLMEVTEVRVLTQEIEDLGLRGKQKKEAEKLIKRWKDKLGEERYLENFD